MAQQRLFAKPALKAAREDKGYTQAEALEALNMILGKNLSLSFYQQVEQGKKNLSFDDAMEVSRLFGAVLGDLFQMPLRIKRNGRTIE